MQRTRDHRSVILRYSNFLMQKKKNRKYQKKNFLSWLFLKTFKSWTTMRLKNLYTYKNRKIKTPLSKSYLKDKRISVILHRDVQISFLQWLCIFKNKQKIFHHPPKLSYLEWSFFDEFLHSNLNKVKISRVTVKIISCERDCQSVIPRQNVRISNDDASRLWRISAQAQ